MSSSYHMEQKIYRDASCTNIIHTREKLFAVAAFKALWVVSFQRE